MRDFFHEERIQSSVPFRFVICSVQVIREIVSNEAFWRHTTDISEVSLFTQFNDRYRLLIVLFGFLVCFFL